ncbi:hypothetical protein ABPG75_009844 [Micractinium tetrahymenae]
MVNADSLPDAAPIVLTPSTCSVPAGPLPTVPQHDPLAGTASWTTGRGITLQPPSPSALLAAMALLDEASVQSSSSPASSAAAPLAPPPPPLLPTGAAWPVLPIVTPDGLQAHAVQPSLAGTVDSRDPRRLTMNKRRTGEE